MRLPLFPLYVRCGSDELHVTSWGDMENPPLVMWHGLARTGRDFDEAAAALSNEYFVICPDTLGRGLSSWARTEPPDYSFAAYSRHAGAILDHFAFVHCAGSAPRWAR